MNLKKIREDFPVLKRKVNDHSLVYLDNAATTQKPKQVIDTIKSYYSKYNSNIHRGAHRLSEEATIAYEEAHNKVAGLINTDFEEIIFTRGTTESLNLLAYSLGKNLKEGDEIVLSQMEHHSNIVPWQMLAKEKGVKLKYLPVEKGLLKLEDAEKLITKKTKIVSITQISNVLGTINPVKKIADLAHEKGAYMIVDGAQSVPNMPVDIKDIDCDFLAFSGHKMLGPTGIGVLYGKKQLLEKLEPFQRGGDMIKTVSWQDATWNDLPWKFEAGTPNIAGGIALGTAVDYLKSIDMKKIQEHEKKLAQKGMKELKKIEGLTLYNPNTNKVPVFSFNLEGIHPHDVTSLLDDHGVAVRGGHHCAMPLMKSMGLNGSVRASLYLYNTEKEIDKLVKAIKAVKRIFK